MSKKPRESELLGALHDVSNALTVLLGWAEEAQAKDASSDSVAYALAVIRDEAYRARLLSRKAIGAPTPEEDAVVDVVVGRVVSSLALEAQKRTVRIVHCQGASLSILDGAPVGQIVANLLLNALAFSPANGTVTVTTTESDFDVVVIVKDEGPGVPVERASSIFDGDSTREGGAGVGLRHARSLARGLGGDLSLEKPGLGGTGATFRVRIPRVPEAPVSFASVVPPPQVSTRGGQLAGVRILVVEDDPAVTGLLEMALTSRGAEVSLAASFDEVTSAPGDQDAILVDLSPILRNVDGAVASMRSKSPRACFIVTSGSADSVPPALAGVRMVRKPFEVSEIVKGLTDDLRSAD